MPWKHRRTASYQKLRMAIGVGVASCLALIVGVFLVVELVDTFMVR